jgi:hypothetical protein
MGASTFFVVILNHRADNVTGEVKAKPEVIKLGLDLHARQVTECRQLDGSNRKLGECLTGFECKGYRVWKLLVGDFSTIDGDHGGPAFADTGPVISEVELNRVLPWRESASALSIRSRARSSRL